MWSAVTQSLSHCISFNQYLPIFFHFMHQTRTVNPDQSIFCCHFSFAPMMTFENKFDYYLRNI